MATRAPATGKPEKLQPRVLLQALKALKRGDFSRRLPDGLAGLDGQIADTFNEILELNQSLSGNLAETSAAIGQEGRTRARAARSGARGGWATYVNAFNTLADDVTRHTSGIVTVVAAVSKGDLSQTVEIDSGDLPIKGNFLRDAKTVNNMVERLGAFGSEVTRVAREVGVEGKLGAQARVRSVSGVWKELTDNVNLMASNLTDQVRDIALVTTAVAQGDLTRKITVEGKGEILQLKDTINTMVDQLSSFSSEVTRVAREVGNEGILGGQAEVKGVSGTWQELTDNVNSMANNLTDQVRDIARVTTAVALGDLSKKITIEVKGEILQLKDTINTMVDQLGGFADEVTRMAREVGTDGILGGQANVPGAAGTWRDLTDNVNSMANNLTNQVRNIAEVTTAVADGDLSKKITVDAKGEILDLKNTINTMVGRLNSFSAEVTRVAREVGTEGTLGGQAEVKEVSGVWKELTDNVNQMGLNLTDQVRNIAEVTTAVANGDLSRKITVDAKGEILQLKNTINQMVDSLGAFGSEVTRMAREVGTEGVLGGQATVRDVSGIWKDLTDNVNLMASNLTNQVRNIADVAGAVAAGDLSKKITVDARGEILELKSTINTMVDQLSSFGAEVSQLARDVGVEGKLGGQAQVEGVRGLWKELTENVNLMTANLTNQVRDIAGVTTSVAKGDLTRKIAVDAKGEILELKNTINTMVDQLSSFAEEVTRLARDVGVEGKLGGQADVRGVAGTWRELTDNVNLMANNLTGQVRNVAQVSTAIAQGDLSRKIAVDAKGEMLELKNTVNTMVDQLSSFAEEVTRVARDVGTEGKLGGQAEVNGVAGTWRDLTDNVNLMASNLTNQVRDIAQVTTAVAQGDLSKKITVEVKGEILELSNTINTMVDQLRSFGDEVTRVAREVGIEGILGGQADVRGVSGTWSDLTENVNLMARNLTEQVRGIARVVTAVAQGDLRQQLALDAKGEIATLVETINNMTITLSTFADQVTGVAHDVGVEGKLGGQANVPGAAGIWRDLTNNVNELAGNLTTQVRAIGDVATAVTKGDLTRSIEIEARGEVALLKDNINQMIGSLGATTKINEEQDWLKTNLTKFTRMLQGQRDLTTVSRQVMSELAPVVNAQHGAFYMTDRGPDRTDSRGNDRVELRLFASYAYTERKHVANRFGLGEGLVGQSAFERQRILITNAPPDYIQISSGLGEAVPVNIVVVPIVFEDEAKGVIELASFQRFSAITLNFLEQLVESLGIVIATIEAQMRTDELLKESQGLTEELQTQQEELQQTNEELEEKAKQLSEQKTEVERKNREVEEARIELEEKAEQLSLTSRYKSEFLANMSHELRTPLNSLLILSRKLRDNPEGSLSEQETEFARIIHDSGKDLLSLINEILDLAKIESGTITLDVGRLEVAAFVGHLQKAFASIAADKQLDMHVEIESGLPEVIRTDPKRLRQILHNLLSNAFKFTERGHVTLRVEPASGDSAPWISADEPPGTMIAFSVTDSGIGIPEDKQRLIFEAFQQAEGGTSRRFGGTGLGLSISRELAGLLGGAIQVQSEPGKGSCFTLYLPEAYRPVSKSGGAAGARETEHLLDGTPEVDGGDAKSGVVSRDGSGIPPAFVADDRNELRPEDRTLLVIEDDPNFASVLIDLARERDFKCLCAGDGGSGLALARQYQPDAITLDLRLPDVDGWVIMDRLKRHPETRHIPVHVISAAEDELARGFKRGAIACLSKPVDPDHLTEALAQLQRFLDRGQRRLLVVEDDAAQRKSIVELIGNRDVETTDVGSGAEALEAIRSERFDCVVLDLRLPDMTGFELLERIKEDQSLRAMPVIVYTGRELSRHDETALREVAETIIVKDVSSPERLLDETALFLHRIERKLPEAKQRMLRELHLKDPDLKDKTVLVVDDDVRNLYAITTVLEGHDMNVLHAENGVQGIAKLEENPAVDIILMDIMMPEMDGYEAMRRIRKVKAYKDLPIIALTAKAMRGDREICIEAGASDYITKPLDAEQLVSLLRVWLYR